EKAWNFVRALFDEDFDVEKANEAIDRALRKRLGEINTGTGNAVLQSDERRQQRRNAAADIHEQAMAVIGQRFNDHEARQAAERAKAEADAAADLKRAQQEYAASLEAAKQARETAESAAATAASEASKALADVTNRVAGVESRGSFSA